jgi:ornithine carbamoyltransferase
VAAPKVAPQPAKPKVAALRAADLISVGDLSPADFAAVLDLAAQVKSRPQDYVSSLAGKQLVMIFEKPSLRTRVTFQTGMASLGGLGHFIDQRDERISAREPVRDVARNLERWVDGIVLRTYEHATITEMAQWARVPVINALSDAEHPCQALADFLTLREKFGALAGLKLAYIGDGNNMAHSLLLAAALAGATISIATPRGYNPGLQIVLQALNIGRETGSRIWFTHDVNSAITGADAVYTDVWASMGQESEAAARREKFAPYQINRELMSRAAAHAVFMHCLPAHRGDEVTDEVIESPASLVFEQAENRLHVQKAILILLLGAGDRLPARSTHA